MTDRNIDFLIIVFAPLIVTVVLYAFFQNQAWFSDVARGIKLGGAVAAYTILLGIAHQIHASLNPDPYGQVRQALLGTWVCRATDKDNQPTTGSFNSITTAADGRLVLVGHGLEASEMSWVSKALTYDDSMLIYIYDVVSPNQFEGYANLTIIPEPGKSGIGRLSGGYAVIGSDIRGGLSCQPAAPGDEQVLASLQ